MYGRDTLAEPMAGTAALGQSGPTGTGAPQQTRNAQAGAFFSDPGTFARDVLSYQPVDEVAFA